MLRHRETDARTTADELREGHSELFAALSLRTPRASTVSTTVLSGLLSDHSSIRFIRDHPHDAAFDSTILRPLDDFGVKYSAPENRGLDGGADAVLRGFLDATTREGPRQSEPASRITHGQASNPEAPVRSSHARSTCRHR